MSSLNTFNQNSGTNHRREFKTVCIVFISIVIFGVVYRIMGEIDCCGFDKDGHKITRGIWFWVPILIVALILLYLLDISEGGGLVR